MRRYVQLRGTGVDPATRMPRPKMIDAFMPKIEDLVEASFGKIGADQVHKKLVSRYHPLLCFLDATGEALAGLLHEGRAGSNTTADHITVLDRALQQIPGR